MKYILPFNPMDFPTNLPKRLGMAGKWEARPHACGMQVSLISDYTSEYGDVRKTSEGWGYYTIKNPPKLISLGKNGIDNEKNNAITLVNGTTIFIRPAYLEPRLAFFNENTEQEFVSKPATEYGLLARQLRDTLEISIEKQSKNIALTLKEQEALSLSSESNKRLVFLALSMTYNITVELLNDINSCHNLLTWQDFDSIIAATLSSPKV